MTASALYEGTVNHERQGPRRHAFRYRVSLAYLDLDELPELVRSVPFWSLERLNLLTFRRSDYLGPPDVPLREAVLDRVEQELARRPTGPVRMLTQLRTLGYVFNPVTFYYCFEPSGALDAIAAEITNTPWGERHTYVLDLRTADASGPLPEWRFPKRFHVSPFFDMDQVYAWRFGEPGERLEVGMTNLEGGRAVFTAGLTGARRPLTAGALARALVRHPLQTFRVHAAIYWQAARLYLKRTPFFTHPAKRTPSPGAPTS